MSDKILGFLPGATAQRDAIHIAVVPVTADQTLQPGDRVDLIPGRVDRVKKSDDPIGIIDPFLTIPVQKGQRCWLLLFPGTVTSLRHEWTHPAFEATKGARDWVEAFAASIGQTFDNLMYAADGYVDAEDYAYDNSERYKDTTAEQWKQFWRHYETLRGKPVREPDAVPFTCAC